MNKKLVKVNYNFKKSINQINEVFNKQVRPFTSNAGIYGQNTKG